MNARDELAALGALYGPTAHDLYSQLPELSEAIAAQLIALYDDPSVDRADRMAIALEGARLHVLRFRQRLVAEGEGHGR